MLLASLTAQIGSHGVYAVFVLMAIDAVFPAASELVLLYAGALAAGAVGGGHVDVLGSRVSSHGWAYVALALAGTLGYFVGALAGWAIGFYGGRPLLEQRGRALHLTSARLDRAERWFARWGDAAALIGRVTPVARSFISIPAGVFRMPLPRYAVLTLVGSAVWAFALAAGGWAAGSAYSRYHHDFRYADYAVVAAVLVALAAWLVRRRRSSTLSRRADDPAR